jgi:hypothetical protein
MLNATMYRILLPGYFAAPHVYANDLTQAFPIPFILIGGKYFFDETIWDHKEYLHLPCKTVDLKFDCISIATLAPLADGSMVCGLKKQLSPCYYIRKGFPCPCDGQAGPHDKTIICHWSRRLDEIRIGPGQSSIPE